MSDNDLVAAMYGAVGEDARWTEVLDAIKVRLGVASAVFQRLVTDGDDPGVASELGRVVVGER